MWDRVCSGKTLSAPAEAEMHFRKPEMYLPCVLQMAFLPRYPHLFPTKQKKTHKKLTSFNIYELSTSGLTNQVKRM